VNSTPAAPILASVHRLGKGHTLRTAGRVRIMSSVKLHPEEQTMSAATRKNQDRIIANEKKILDNQNRILRDLEAMLKNQKKILANQSRILAK
jgi:hypothetical protein